MQITGLLAAVLAAKAIAVPTSSIWAGSNGNWTPRNLTAMPVRPMLEGPMPEGTSFNLSGPQQSSHHVRRTGTLGLYECRGNDFTGKCLWTIADGGACHQFKYAGSSYKPKSVSAGPDKGLSCNFFYSLDCTKWMNYEGVVFPGITDTMNSPITKPAVNKDLGTKHNWALSYQCHPL